MNLGVPIDASSRDTFRMQHIFSKVCTVLELFESVFSDLHRILAGEKKKNDYNYNLEIVTDIITGVRTLLSNAIISRTAALATEKRIVCRWKKILLRISICRLTASFDRVMGSFLVSWVPIFFNKTVRRYLQLNSLGNSNPLISCGGHVYYLAVTKKARCLPVRPLY